MIKFLIIATLVIPSIASSETRHYKSTVCYDKDFLDCEVLNEYDYYHDDGLDARGRGKNGSGLRHLVDSVYRIELWLLSIC